MQPLNVFGESDGEHAAGLGRPTLSAAHYGPCPRNGSSDRGRFLELASVSGANAGGRFRGHAEQPGLGRRARVSLTPDA